MWNMSKSETVIAFTVPNTKAATELIIRNPQLFNDYEITKGKMDDVFLLL